MNILDLPDCVLELVMSYMTYDDIAKYRIVSELSFKSNIANLSTKMFQDMQEVQPD